MEDVLKVINTDLVALGINYEFGEWTSEPVYPYFVGEYQEEEPMNEDGLQESTFILDGFTRSSWLSLEKAKNKIKNLYNPTSGKVVITEQGSAVAIFYSDSLIIPTGDAELKKIEIRLSIKKWSVN